MSMLHPAINEESNDEAANRQTASLGGLAITLLLLVIALSLVRQFQTKAMTEWAPTMQSAIATASLTEV